MTLQDIMEFDHVVQVLADGTVMDTGLYAPELYHVEGEQSPNDVEGHGDGWTLLTGFTGQYGYNGAVMHASEYIGVGLERQILENPGYYVACVVNCDDDDEPAGWAIAYRAVEHEANDDGCPRCGKLHK